MISKEFEDVWRQIIAKAWHDEKFKKRLLAHPNEVLKEHGIKLPENVSVEVEEASPNAKKQVIRIFLPQKPSFEEMKKDRLLNLSAGVKTQELCH